MNEDIDLQLSIIIPVFNVEVYYCPTIVDKKLTANERGTN